MIGPTLALGFNALWFWHWSARATTSPLGSMHAVHSCKQIDKQNSAEIRMHNMYRAEPKKREGYMREETEQSKVKPMVVCIADIELGH